MEFSYTALITVLNEAKVSHVVVLHGYPRLTGAIDLVLELAEVNVALIDDIITMERVAER